MSEFTKKRSDDIPRAALMSALIEVQHKMQSLPGGMNGALIIFVIVLASIDGKTVNVSTIAHSLGMDRKTVRRTLDTLVAGGYIDRRDDIEDWPVYTRTCCQEVHEWSRRWCNEVYGILQHRLKPFCDTKVVCPDEAESESKIDETFCTTEDA